VGVPQFFVLSGFLITGVLLDTERELRAIAIFYLRRAVRIFPIYYLTFGLILGIAVAAHWAHRDWPLFAVYLQNFKLAPAINSSFPPMFNHTWSLAVEEQFYLFWPALIAVFGQRRLPLFCAVVIFVCAVGRLITEHTLAAPAWVWAYDCLAWGAIGAIAVRRGIAAPRLLLALTVAASTCVAVIAAMRSNAIFVMSLGPLFLATILLVHQGVMVKALEWAPLRALGRMSYGVYLYHPLFLYAAAAAAQRVHLKDGLLPGLVGAGAAVLTAYLSYFYLERPLLRWRDRLSLGGGAASDAVVSPAPAQ
jgi:peptidoglycan/LPS O-acetylase OafA/YrhL